MKVISNLVRLCCSQLKKLMVVGIDTYHDSAKKGRSVGGFVASLNDSLTRYYSQATMQMSHQELIGTLRLSLVGRCALLDYPYLLLATDAAHWC